MLLVMLLSVAYKELLHVIFSDSEVNFVGREIQRS